MKTFKEFIYLQEQLSRRDFLRSAGTVTGALAMGGSVLSAGQPPRVSANDPKLVDILLDSPDPESIITQVGADNYEKVWGSLEFALFDPNYANKKDKIIERIRLVRSLIGKRDRERETTQKAAQQKKEQAIARERAERELPSLAKKVASNEDGLREQWAQQFADKLWYYEYAAALKPEDAVLILKRGGLVEEDVNRVLRLAAAFHKDVGNWLKPVLK